MVKVGARGRTAVGFAVACPGSPSRKRMPRITLHQRARSLTVWFSGLTHRNGANPRSGRSLFVGGEPLAVVDSLNMDVRDVDAVGQVHAIEELAQRRTLVGLDNLLDERALGGKQMLAVLGACHAPVVEIVRIEGGRGAPP